MTETILEGPIEWVKLTEEMKKQFTLDGRIRAFDLYLENNISDKVGLFWPRIHILNGILQACRRQDLAGIRTYDARSVLDLYKILDKHSVTNKDILVIGSVKPWIEICCLAFGAKTVTTVDYNPPVSEYHEIRTVSVDQFEKEAYKYDILISYSSLEHDGLGRYGDPIDPEGDLKRMRSYLDIIKPSGLFFLESPVGRIHSTGMRTEFMGKSGFPC